MFVVINIGGIGNQLFQYAFAKKLSRHTNRKVILSSTVTFGKDDRGRIAILPKLNTDMEFTSGWEAFSINMVYRLHRFIKKRFNHDIASSQKLSIKYEEELTNLLNHTRKDDDFFDKLDRTFSQDRVFLVGYWHDSDIVNSSKQDLMREFSYSGDLSADNKWQMAQIEQHKESVALHLRLEEYHHNKEYYQNSVKFIRNKRRNPFFIVFADSNRKARKYLQGIIEPDDYLIMPNSNYKDAIKDYQSLILMSKCQDFIMSRSTFCWWSAWLNWAGGKNPQGVYILPEDFKHRYNFSPQYVFISNT